MADFPEKDWKYLSKLRPELLEELSRRITDELRALLQTPGISENDRRSRVYDLVQEKDRVVAACFDDWCRSQALNACLHWKRHGLLKKLRRARDVRVNVGQAFLAVNPDSSNGDASKSRDAVGGACRGVTGRNAYYIAPHASYPAALPSRQGSPRVQALSCHFSPFSRVGTFLRGFAQGVAFGKLLQHSGGNRGGHGAACGRVAQGGV